MAAKAIGLCKCPVCGSEKARASVSVRGLVCVTCNRCHMQLFARSEISDERIREKLLPLPVVAAAEPPRAAAPEQEMTVQADYETPPPEAPEKKRNAFDIY